MPAQAIREITEFSVSPIIVSGPVISAGTCLLPIQANSSFYGGSFIPVFLYAVRACLHFCVVGNDGDDSRPCFAVIVGEYHLSPDFGLPWPIIQFPTESILDRTQQQCDGRYIRCLLYTSIFRIEHSLFLCLTEKFNV